MDLIVTPEEFQHRLLDFAEQYNLVFFSLHQRTKELQKLNRAELVQYLSEAKKWQLDLWCSRSYPQDASTAIPAREGWILVRHPYVLAENRLSIANVGIQPYWTEGEPRGKCSNENLKKLFASFKIAISKGAKMHTVKTVWKDSSSTVDRMRCSLGAINLQKADWRFVDQFSPGSLFVEILGE
ncbi:MAG: hypothetical protein C0508_31080 [Cyanobacteria bacterium PR.023]|nr:hypothetical protein [Cyanobacteria bacterium PR.023]